MIIFFSYKTIYIRKDTHTNVSNGVIAGPVPEPNPIAEPKPFFGALLSMAANKVKESQTKG